MYPCPALTSAAGVSEELPDLSGGWQKGQERGESVQRSEAPGHTAHSFADGHCRTRMTTQTSMIKSITPNPDLLRFPRVSALPLHRARNCSSQGVTPRDSTMLLSLLPVAEFLMNTQKDTSTLLSLRCQRELCCFPLLHSRSYKTRVHRDPGKHHFFSCSFTAPQFLQK